MALEGKLDFILDTTPGAKKAKDETAFKRLPIKERREKVQDGFLAWRDRIKAQQTVNEMKKIAETPLQ